MGIKETVYVGAVYDVLFKVKFNILVNMVISCLVERSYCPHQANNYISRL